MTEAEKIRNDVEELLRSGAHEVFSPEAATTDIALILELSWPALAWCRDNKEVVEALASGTWQAVPKELSSNMDAAARVALDREPDYSRAGFSAWWWHNALASAPKKPE